MRWENSLHCNVIIERGLEIPREWGLIIKELDSIGKVRRIKNLFQIELSQGGPERDRLGSKLYPLDRAAEEKSRYNT